MFRRALPLTALIAVFAVSPLVAQTRFNAPRGALQAYQSDLTVTGLEVDHKNGKIVAVIRNVGNLASPPEGFVMQATYSQRNPKVIALKPLKPIAPGGRFVAVVNHRQPIGTTVTYQIAIGPKGDRNTRNNSRTKRFTAPLPTRFQLYVRDLLILDAEDRNGDEPFIKWNSTRGGKRGSLVLGDNVKPLGSISMKMFPIHGGKGGFVLRSNESLGFIAQAYDHDGPDPHDLIGTGEVRLSYNTMIRDLIRATPIEISGIHWLQGPERIMNLKGPNGHYQLRFHVVAR